MTYIASLPACTNAEDFGVRIKLLNRETGLPYDDTAAINVKVEVRPISDRNWRSDYGFWRSRETAVLSGDLDDGVVSLDGEMLTIRWDDSAMKALCPGLYGLGCILEEDGATVQFFIATFSVLEGYPK